MQWGLRLMGPRAMVVDDAPDIRRLLHLVLSIAGYNVIEAANGADALGLLRKGELPDIVVLDVQMPDVDGWETLERLRADPRTARMPVIVCTVKAVLNDSLRAWRLGCDGFVTKPVDIGDLVAEVEVVLARDETERSALRQAHIDELMGA